ncbi:MAG: diguanylate cyclase [Rhodocyclaceae bacterium]|nr:diguanylate cyclase [Rhodocyclaceae bacterium]
MATILIVDDRVPRRRQLALLLGRMGHRTEEAASGEQALAAIRAAGPDLLLIDILMPHPGGYQFLRELHAQAELALPRLLYLAPPHMASEARLLAQASGFAGQVVDSADSGALRATIDDALSRPPPAALAARPAAGDDRLYPLVSRLCGRVAELETYNAQLQRNSAMRTAQLEVARSALDREVVKRLWTEEDMNRENQRLRAHALRDPLTGLYNRRYLEESLAREESRAKRSGRPLSMMMVDVDDFKRCNDTFGHAAGDEVLRAVGRCMESLARSEDILCRYGGEKFALVMTNTAPATLWQRADALRAGAPKLRVEHDRRAIGPVTLSIALAIFPDNGNSAYTILQMADAALFQSKPGGGGNRIVVAGVAQH